MTAATAMTPEPTHPTEWRTTVKNDDLSHAWFVEKGVPFRLARCGKTEFPSEVTDHDGAKKCMHCQLAEGTALADAHGDRADADRAIGL